MFLITPFPSHIVLLLLIIIAIIAFIKHLSLLGKDANLGKLGILSIFVVIAHFFASLFAAFVAALLAKILLICPLTLIVGAVAGFLHDRINKKGIEKYGRAYWEEMNRDNSSGLDD